MARAEQTVSIAGHRLRLTHPDRVLYPSTGTTKADVIAYYVEIAPHLLPHVAGRIVTRKRWVDGVGTSERPGDSFFEKNLPTSAPSWIRRVDIEHSDHHNTYPVLESEAGLAWAGQVSALELHVPQWRVDPAGRPLNPDRIVLDLDPGPGAGLPECVEVAKRARRLLAGLDLELHPVTSGSKGLHLYAALDGSHDSDYIRTFAREVAQVLESDLPDLVVSTMSKKVRGDKVLVDWSQNHPAKTTVAPYSLRGRTEPTVAVPRTWRELADPGLRQLRFDEVLKRMRRRKDPLRDLYGTVEPHDPEPARDQLATYRSRRDPRRTPEPVPSTRPDAPDSRSFVIQEHHASRLHWDFRLEHNGVLVSWALPKGVPTDPARNHLAVQTEDHPLEYGTFEGTIPAGEYGGGDVTIWDAGTFSLQKWRDDEVIATLTGREGGGLGGTRSYALIRTGGKNWLIHLMKEQAPRSSARAFIEPMLATLGSVDSIADERDWAFEMKWDGVRVVAVAEDDRVGLFSRTGRDVTATYPEVADALRRSGVDGVLDGEVVALGSAGAPSFGLLQERIGLSRPADVERAAARVPVHYLVFDVLRANGDGLRRSPYGERREVLGSLLDGDGDGDVVRVPPAFEGNLDDAVESSRSLGLEGVLAKRLDSTYRSGSRSRSWVKIKHQRTQDVVIGGWRPGKGARSGGIGSLLLGVPGDDGLVYVGRVGTGLSEHDLATLSTLLGRSTRKTSPFVEVPKDVARDARWVTPRLVGEVAFTDWTADGRLRHPTWRGLRDDV